MKLLPKTTRLIVSESSVRPSSEQLRDADHVFLLEPKQKSRKKWSKLPLQSTIDYLMAQASVKTAVLSHPGDARTAALSYSTYADKLSTFEMLTLARQLFATLKGTNPVRVLFLCNDQSDEQRAAFALAIAAAGHAYVCPLTVFKKSKPPTSKTRYLDIYGSSGLDIKRLESEANGNNIARVLAALPPNVLNADRYIDTCRNLAAKRRWEFELFDQTRLQQLGAGAFLAVAQGNPHGNAGIVRLRRTGKQQTPRVSLVGKGVCFDTGGANLKNASGMQEMHEDMQGSSVALGTFHALCELCPDDTLECWLAITENRLDGDAYTPTEIITAINGKTIEVIHTDAEGRMALADTLHLACQNKPQLIIDYATLTGACVFALTSRYSGAFSNRKILDTLIQNAGTQSGERAWAFPVDKDFDALLKSNYADLKQCSLDSKGDHISAARFLSNFVDRKIPWLHIDLSSGHHPGGLAHINSDVTGVGVRLTCNLVLDQHVHDHL